MNHSNTNKKQSSGTSSNAKKQESSGKHTTSSSKPQLNKKKFKSDEEDEESKSFMEKQTLKDNNEKINFLSSQVSAIKSIGFGLSNQLKEDKAILSTLDGGFDKTKMMVSKTLSKMDEMVSKGANSMWTYVLIFTIMLLALLYKLG